MCPEFTFLAKFSFAAMLNLSVNQALLTELASLNLFLNPLTADPQAISRLRNLVTLSLANTRLDVVPDFIYERLNMDSWWLRLVVE